MATLTKAQLGRIWKQLDGACEALELMGYYEDGQKLLDKYENRVDFSALVNMKNNVEDFMEKKSRKKRLG
jgi:hypothetical protein